MSTIKKYNYVVNLVDSRSLLSVSLSNLHASEISYRCDSKSANVKIQSFNYFLHFEMKYETTIKRT